VSENNGAHRRRRRPIEPTGDEAISTKTEVNSLVRRARILLEDEEWTEACGLIERALDTDPEYAPAYVAKVMAQYHVRKESDLYSLGDEYELSPDWKRAIRFASEDQRGIYETCVSEAQSNRRNKETYKEAEKILKEADSIEGCQRAILLFESILAFEDSESKIEECKVRAAQITANLEQRYKHALELMDSAKTSQDYESVAKRFSELGNYRDSMKHRTESYNRLEKCAKRERRIGWIKRFIISVVIIAAVICAYYYWKHLDNLPVFATEEEMEERIQGIYVLDMSEEKPDYYRIEGKSINWVIPVDRANIDLVKEWEIKRLAPETGTIYAEYLGDTVSQAESVHISEFYVRKNAGYLSYGGKSGNFKKEHDYTRIEGWKPAPIRTPTPTPRPTPKPTPYEDMSTALEIKNLKLYHERNYAYVTGSVKNTGRKRYEYVRVRAVLKDASGSIIDTDWTYAVGSEGLRPNEEKKFEMMIRDEDREIESVSVSLME